MLKQRLKKIINEKEDDIRYYGICNKDRSKIVFDGITSMTQNNDYYLLWEIFVTVLKLELLLEKSNISNLDKCNNQQNKCELASLIQSLCQKADNM